MAQLIPRDFIDQVIAQTDIVALVDSYVPLKKLGTSYKACCPFHQEKSPSFVVSAQKQIYHCFGCGVGGNAVSFLMEYEHLSFVEAIKQLAKQLSMTVPTTSETRRPRDESVDDYYQAMALAVAFYRQQLKQHPEAEAAKRYLIERGLSGEIAAKYGLGYAPAGWDTMQKAVCRQTTTQALLKAGLIIAKDGGGQYDRFRARVIYPIRDRQGRFVGLGGRILDQGEPKYLNSPETAIFHKSNTLYGFYELLQHQRSPAFIVIVEGYMDVLALAQHGVPQVVGTLGTATTAEHIRTLFRYTDEVVFCFDGDKAGKAAAWRALTVVLPIYQDGKRARFMFLPEGEDPDSFIRAKGRSSFTEAMGSAEGLSEFFINTLCAGVNLSEAEGRAELLAQGQLHLKAMPDSHLRQILANELASRAKVSVAQLPSASASGQVKQPSLIKENQSLSPLRHALSILLQHPALVADLGELSFPRLPGQEILVELLELITANPNINTAGILEFWRDQKYYPRLVQLSSQPLLVPPSGLLAELKDTLNRLQQTATLQRIEELMTKAGTNSLSIPEKQELQELLAQGA